MAQVRSSSLPDLSSQHTLRTATPADLAELKGKVTTRTSAVGSHGQSVLSLRAALLCSWDGGCESCCHLDRKRQEILPIFVT